MDHYNLRTTSLSNAQLTTELTKRNAQTFGTVQRKQQRLQRFIDAETLRAEREQHLQRFLDREDARIARREARRTLRITIENEPRAVSTRAQTRASELRRSSRIRELLGQYLGY